MLVDVYLGEKRTRILFDTGLTETVLLHNMSALNILPNEIDHAVLSHGHPDHYGGLKGLLKARDYPLVVTSHPDAFLVRHVNSAGGLVIPYFNYDFRLEELEAAGGRFILTRDPMVICPAAMTTGEIPLNVSFEPPGPPMGTPSAQWCLRDGRIVEDKTLDDLALVINLEGKGLVVVCGCSHAGIINTIRRAMEVSGVNKLYALFGGFHLGFPGIPFEKTISTIDELKAMNPKVVSPMHCSGFNTLAFVKKEMPDAFLLNTTGAEITL
jgi:7,8-dihydropterin-6-yl-methyl-4-(beta-D-ribofuranosyl)aminobenzene 5'-phosphate synthase